MKHPKDLEEPIPGEHRAKEGEACRVIGAPVILEVSQLNYPHVQEYCDETLHLIYTHRFPVPVQGAVRDCRCGELFLCIQVCSLNQVLPHGVVKKQREAVLWSRTVTFGPDC